MLCFSILNSGLCRDLADLNNNGLLTRDGFAVAMHLIQLKLAGKDIPTTLPTSLIPPSMRNNAQAPPKPQIPEAMRDLLWDDTPQAPVMQPQATGTLSPQHTASPPQIQHAQHSVFGATDPFSNSQSPFANSQSPFASAPGRQTLKPRLFSFLLIIFCSPSPCFPEESSG